MKKFCVVMLLSVVMMGNVWGQNLITNGGFEDGKNDWHIARGTIDTVEKNAGLQSVKLVHTGAQENILVSMIEGLEPLATYKASGYFKVDSAGGVLQRPFYIHYQPLKKVFHVIKDDRPEPRTYSWTLFENIFFVNSDIICMQAGKITGNVTVWIDDVSLTLVKDRAANKTYYTSILASGIATERDVTLANSFFGDLYYHIEIDLAKAITYLEALDWWNASKRIGEAKLLLGDYAGAKIAFQTAAAKAIQVQASANAIKEIGQQLEGVKMLLGEE